MPYVFLLYAIRPGLYMGGVPPFLQYCMGQSTRHHGVFWGRMVLTDKITDKLKWELYLQKRTPEYSRK